MIKGCGECLQYTKSCRVLEGFECCKCCGVGNCEYDICPADKKLPIKITVEELFYEREVRWGFNLAYNTKNAILSNNFNDYYYKNYQRSKDGIEHIQTILTEDKKIRPHIKKELMDSIKTVKSIYEEIENLILKKDLKNLK